MFIKKKENWLEWVKTISIILIVYIHILALYAKNEDLKCFFTYVVPVFFIISGYFHKPGNKFKPYFLKNIKLLVAYFGYALINYLPWALQMYFVKVPYAISFTAEDLLFKPLMGLFLGNGYSTPISYAIAPPLWFLISLFVVKMLAFTLAKTNNYMIALYAVICSLLAFIIIKYIHFQVFSIATSLAYYPFFILGYFLKKFNFRKKISRKYLYLPLSCVFLIITFFISKYNLFIDLNVMYYGNNYLMFNIGGLFFSMAVIFISLRLNGWDYKDINTNISSNTLHILCLHGIVLRFVILIVWLLLGINIFANAAIFLSFSLIILILVFILLKPFISLVKPFISYLYRKV